MPPIPLVATFDEAEAAITAFTREVAASPELGSRVAYHRAWYALKTEAGWHYAPSKWAGHAGLDAATYLARADALDGRRTDAILAAWFAPAADPRRQEKHLRRLREMFVSLGGGQTPNARARILEISIPVPGAEKESDRRLVDLLEAVFRTLPVPAQAALRKRIG